MISILETFNAKHHDANKLASTFVPSDNFKKVAQRGHTIIIGPRGSGKTTLLRMLTSTSLASWEHAEASYFRNQIDYEGIYVPGDIVWGQMIRALNRVGIDDISANAFAYTSFSTHVFYSVMDALQVSLDGYIKKVGLEKFKERNVELTSALFDIARLLKINVSSVSIRKLKSELSLRIVELGEYSTEAIETKELSLEILRERLPYSKLDMRQTVEEILNIFDDALIRTEHRWALLLDEFEIAPQHLVEGVVSSMRSSARKLMLKVALVPCASQANLEAEISSLNDLEIVELWYRKRGESKKFCEDILFSTFAIRDPRVIFGSTDYIDQIDNDDSFTPSLDLEKKELQKYKNEIKLGIFKELYNKDESFKKYIDKNKIDIEREFNGECISSRIRKITPIVIFRNEMILKAGVKKPKASIAQFYTGWDAITRISEGNPRWLIATISSLTAEVGRLDQRIDKDKQFLGIKRSTDAFASMIASTARKNNMGITSKESPFEVIEKIARYFQSQIIGRKFRTDPNGCFMVDKNTPSEIEKSLRIALNHGAIVALDENNAIWDYRNLVGKRFRISYLFSPYFRLPLRMEKDIHLSTILQEDYKNNDLIKTANLFLDVDQNGQGALNFD